MYLNEILEEIQRKEGISKIETDSFGVTRLLINDTYLIHLRPSADETQIFLYAKVGTLPQSAKRIELCEELLSANLFGDETHSAFLALHRPTNSVVLMQAFDAETLTFEFFWHELEQFIGTLKDWKNKLTQVVEEGKAAYIGSETDILSLMSQRKQQVLFI